MHKVHSNAFVVAEPTDRSGFRASERRRCSPPPTAAMVRIYFVQRLLQALNQADAASSEKERSVHLRTSRYYRDLIESLNRRN
jgi:methylphosphotriester-DNA--protein-cysteine methyltransferase